ncbi:MAG: YiiX/YebB-like N1pC/P60 family cysteine hydrolase [Sphingobium sp.]|nr:lipo-like protein [Alphaproteobacteria bacterium]
MQALLGKWLAAFLNAERHVHSASPPTNPTLLKQILHPGDVLLIEGYSRISTAIKYLTQSTWSHAALYVGDHPNLPPNSPRPHAFIEADLLAGVRVTGIANYSQYHSRICRPIGLTEADQQALLAYAVSRIGHRYDVKNVIDLVRYLLPTPPVPTSWRRKMIAFGSGDPTRAICSTLIAQAFQTIKYPVLPLVTTVAAATPTCLDCLKEVLRIRHHSLFVPRDFDVSPYFKIVKPSLEGTFDHRLLEWSDLPEEAKPNLTAITEEVLSS